MSQFQAIELTGEHVGRQLTVLPDSSGDFQDTVTGTLVHVCHYRRESGIPDVAFTKMRLAVLDNHIEIELYARRKVDVEDNL